MKCCFIPTVRRLLSACPRCSRRRRRCRRPFPPSKYSDETRPISELFRLELLPRLNRGETCKMFSSYDRTGGNDDGFSGKYSKLREENGNSVLAEMDGPGCIQRMFFTHSEYGMPGLLGRKGEHIRIYLDGEKKPALDVPLEDIFYGKLEGFPKPLADVALGGFYCYVPIPYKKSCKVVVDGTGVKFYQIVYRTFPTDKGIVTFRYPPSEPQRKALANGREGVESCGEMAPLVHRRIGSRPSRSSSPSRPANRSIGHCPKGRTWSGPCRLKIKPEQIQNANGARLQITWDGAKSPAVDLPLDYFYCQAKKPGPFRSLLVGSQRRRLVQLHADALSEVGQDHAPAAKPLEGDADAGDHAASTRDARRPRLPARRLQRKPADQDGHISSVPQAPRTREDSSARIWSPTGRTNRNCPFGSKATSNSPATANCGFTAPARKTVSTAAGTRCPAG